MTEGGLERAGRAAAEKSSPAPLWPGLVAALAAFFVYLPALGNGFVRWDDHVYVYENPHIKNLDAGFFKWAFTGVVNSNWHPLTLLSYGLDRLLWGLDPQGYHLTNILLHGANTFLVYIVIYRLVSIRWKRARAAAFTAAILFALHPLHVESVAWISERKDVLSALFFLLSAFFYLRFRAEESWRKDYASALLFFFLALLSKPMAVTLPVVLLLIDLYPLERFTAAGEAARAFIEKTPFFILALTSAAVTLWAQKTGGAIASLAVSPFYERFDVAVRGFSFYLYKMFWPAGLVPFYVRPLKGEFFNYVFFLSLSVFVFISLFSAFMYRKGKKVYAVLWLYYVVTLLPVIGLVQVSDHAAADRYFYLPGIAPILLVGLGAAFLFERARGTVRPVLYGTGIALFIVLAVQTERQIRVWHDTVSLWTREIEIYPVLPAYINRADAYLRAGKMEKAVRDYTVAIRNARKGLDSLYFKRGQAFLSLGDYRAAIGDFSSALRSNPRLVPAYNNRANALMRLGEVERAVSDYRKALVLDPKNPVLLFNLGSALLRAGRKDEARGYLERASEMGIKEAQALVDGR